MSTLSGLHRQEALGGARRSGQEVTPRYSQSPRQSRPPSRPTTRSPRRRRRPEWSEIENRRAPDPPPPGPAAPSESERGEDVTASVLNPTRCRAMLPLPDSGASSRAGRRKRVGRMVGFSNRLKARPSRPIHQLASGHEADELAESVVFCLPVRLQSAESGLVAGPKSPPESVGEEFVHERLSEKSRVV